MCCAGSAPSRSKATTRALGRCGGGADLGPDSAIRPEVERRCARSTTPSVRRCGVEAGTERRERDARNRGVASAACRALAVIGDCRRKPLAARVSVKCSTALRASVWPSPRVWRVRGPAHGKEVSGQVQSGTAPGVWAGRRRGQSGRANGSKGPVHHCRMMSRAISQRRRG